MNDSPYRPCPVCRNGMKPKVGMPEWQEGQKIWHCYECSNCGSEVWILPFNRIRKSKSDKKPFWKRL